MKGKLWFSSLLLLAAPIGCSTTGKTFRDHCCSDSAEATGAYNEAISKDKAGDWAEAIRLYEQALRISPNYTCARVNLGLLYWEDKRLNDAYTELSKASAMEPRDVILHGNLGGLQKELGNLGAAEAEFQKAADLNPKRGKAFYRLAGVQKDQKKYDEAAANYEKFLAATDSESKDSKLVAYAHSYLSWYAKRSSKSSSGAESTSRGAANKKEAITESLSVNAMADKRHCTPESHALVILLDKSGSVKDDDLVKSEKSATAKLIPQLHNNILFSLVAFDSTPFVLVKETKLNPKEKEIAARRLEFLFPTGKTNLLPALGFARSSLQKSSGKCKSIILMSDGKIPITPTELVAELDNIRSQGIFLSVLQLGFEGDRALMQMIARAGHGAYLQASGSKSIDQALTEAARSLKLLQEK